MKITERIIELKSLIKGSLFNPVGLVPTMGALHEGHISLVRRAIETSPLVVVSIYVNPAQFNDKEDFSGYPRTMDKDLDLLEGIMRPNDIVFTPTDREMYPEADNRKFNFDSLEKVMEGPLRPGHFNGVGQIVSKLFRLIEPDKAYFGLKDFQQVAVIKELVRQMGVGIEVVGCPTVRESDGLAMSSRNRLLEPEIRKQAPIIYKTIRETIGMFGIEEISVIRRYVGERIAGTSVLSLEYFEIVDDTMLIPIIDNTEIDQSKNYYGCIAVNAGKVRLIDNIPLISHMRPSYKNC